MSARRGDKRVVPLIGENAAAIVIRNGVAGRYGNVADEGVAAVVAQWSVGVVDNGLYRIAPGSSIGMPDNGAGGRMAVAEIPVEVCLVGVAIGVEQDFVSKAE